MQCHKAGFCAIRDQAIRRESESCGIYCSMVTLARVVPRQNVIQD